MAGKRRTGRVEAPKTGIEDAETAGEVAADIARITLRAIRAQIQALGGGAATSAATKQVAQLAERAAKVSAELRKAEKGAVDALDRVSPGALLAWMQRQTPEFRARHIREVAAMDARGERGSVLGR